MIREREKLTVKEIKKLVQEIEKRQKLWLKKFKKSVILSLDYKLAVKIAEEEFLFVKNWKYFMFIESKGLKMIDGEIGCIMTNPVFIRLIAKPIKVKNSKG
jgi:hypothetical protein